MLTVMQAEGYRDALRKKMIKDGKSRIQAWAAVNPVTVSREEIGHALASAVAMAPEHMTGALPVLQGAKAFDGHIFKQIVEALTQFAQSDFGKFVIEVLEKLIMGLIV